MKSLENAIDRARFLIANVHNAAMATVNADGSPHNTPYMFLINDARTELYWSSSPHSVHSQNVVRTGMLYVVLYEANQGGGLYIQAINGRICNHNELERALNQHNRTRIVGGKEPLSADYYNHPSTQNMWIADIKQCYVNRSKRDHMGRVVQDIRTAIASVDIVVNEELL